jgi:hypothetical protein
MAGAMRLFPAGVSMRESGFSEAQAEHIAAILRQRDL